MTEETREEWDRRHHCAHTDFQELAWDMVMDLRAARAVIRRLEEERDELDPNATLKQIQKAIQTGDIYRTKMLCSKLQTWLCKSGFDPDWKQFPEGTIVFDAWRKMHNVTT